MRGGGEERREKGYDNASVKAFQASYALPIFKRAFPFLKCP